MRREFQRAFNVSTNRVKVAIGLGTCGIAAGGEKVWNAVNEYVENEGLDVDMMSTGCLGMCYAEPIMEVHMPGEPRFVYGNVKPETAVEILERHLKYGRPSPEYIVGQDPRGFEPAPNIMELKDTGFFKSQVKTVLGRCGIIDPEQIAHYIAFGGYEALEKVLSEMSQIEVIEEIKRSGLRGRGGGGFPTGRKWEAAYNSPGPKKYVICNADEGDPGAFMDRSILEGDPHSVLEGMAICGYAIGADEGYIYVPAEYPLAIKRLRKAI